VLDAGHHRQLEAIPEEDAVQEVERREGEPDVEREPERVDGEEGAADAAHARVEGSTASRPRPAPGRKLAPPRRAATLRVHDPAALRLPLAARRAPPRRRGDVSGAGRLAAAAPSR
jgi:hypothetical protein